LSLIYGTIQLTNFSHGEMVTFGAIITWYLNQSVGLPLPLAAVLGVLIGAASGAGLELGLWRPLRRRKLSLFGLMTVSFGLSLLALNLFQYFFGARNKPYTGTVGGGGFELGSRVIPARTVITIVIALVVLGAVGTFLRTARFGKAMRAVADNPALAASSGIDVDRVVLLVWVMGAGLAAMGGVLYSTSFQVNFMEGQQLLLLMFAGITLGGLGTAFGAAAGCFLLGLAIQLSTLFIPTSLRNVGALVVLIVVLMFAPQGIFGRRERVG
jgi:branched-chain amino acid transport system permease protein